MTLLLGIDVGTTNIKSLLLDADDASIVAVAVREYPLHHPQAGYVEQSPEDWWQATRATIQDVRAQAPDREIAAISFSGQMHGTILLDQAGQVLHPAIIWADQRSAEQVQGLLHALNSADDYIAITGTQPATGFMGATLLWLKQHRPDLLDACQHILLPKDYVRYRLTGEIATDVSDAAGTGIFDVRHQRWADAILDAVGLPADKLPPVLLSDDVAGQLLPDVAAELGLPAGIPVVAGCADQPAQALGNGIIGAGLSSITIGSGGQIFYPLAAQTPDSLRTDSRVHVFNHAAGGWYALGAILAAGLTLRWLRDLLGLRDDPDAYARLSAEAAAVPVGAQGLIFLPHLNGERTPHMDERARGAFIGLASHHERGHLARAVMESIAFALRQSYEICEELGQPADIVLSGGGVMSPIWRQILADVMERPLYRTQQHEQASVGAAMLGGVGVRLFADDRAANFVAVNEKLAHLSDVTEPQADSSIHYADIYAHYLELYPRLRADFHRLAK